MGWHRDNPDHRDHLYAAPGPLLQALPASVDLRPQCPLVYSQGNLGSCTSNAIAGALAFDQRKQGLPEFPPSRLFIYYCERAREGTTSVDSGAYIRDGIKCVNRQGVCTEMLWPYDIPRFAVMPPIICYQEASHHRALSYQRIARSLNQMKACLASGLPFVFGFSVYESFESQSVAQTGIVPMPGSNEPTIGGHACLCVGYQDDKQVWICRNSWTAQWGDQGYFYLPYQYLLDGGLSADFWTIQTIQ